MYHIFDIDVATEYGIYAAIILYNLYFWCQHNKANEKCYHDGLYWTFNSAKAFAEQFPYMSEYQIRAALQKLEDGGLIVSGCFNKNPHDRTKWYACTKTADCIFENQKIHLQKTKNPNFENPKCNKDINKDKNKDVCNLDAFYNPFGDPSDAPDTPQPHPLLTYAEANLKSLSYGNRNELMRIMEKLPEDVIRHVIDETCAVGVSNWAYVRKVLRSYIDDGITTMAQVEAREKQREEERKRAERNRQAQQAAEENPLARAKFY